MKKTSSRRLFLHKSAIATAGVVLLSSTTFANNFTNNYSPFEGYNPYSEEKTDLRTSTLFGKHLTVKGKIYDELGINPLSKVNIEVWHLSPNSKSYGHKAKFNTNDKGEYLFITDFPNKNYGKMPRIFFKISDSNKTYFTELLLDNANAHITDKHWTENKQLKNKLFPIKEDFQNSSTINFNITF